MATPLINGRAYDFVNINVLIGGVSLASVMSISYEETQEKVNNYGAGSRPVSRGHGAIECSGSIELSMNDTAALRLAATDRNLLNIPAFDIVVIYGNDGSNPTRTETIKNVEFTADGVDTSQGDTDNTFEFDFIFSHIVRG